MAFFQKSKSIIPEPYAVYGIQQFSSNCVWDPCQKVGSYLKLTTTTITSIQISKLAIHCKVVLLQRQQRTVGTIKQSDEVS